MPRKGTATQIVPLQAVQAVVIEQPLDFEPIALEVFGRLEVNKSKGILGKLPIAGNMNTNGRHRRAVGGKYNRNITRTGEITFYCYDSGEEELYDDSDRNMYQDLFNYEVYLVSKLRRLEMTNREVEAAALLFDTAMWPLAGNTGKNVTNPWNAANGTPIADHAWALQKLRINGGNPRSAVSVMDWATFMSCLNNPEVVSNKKYVVIPDQMASDANKAALAMQLGVRKVIVGGITKNTKAEGVTPSFDGVWNPAYCWVGNVAQTNDPSEFVVGRTYVNVDDGGDEVAEVYRMDDIRSDIYRFRGTQGAQVNSAACGILLGTVYTP